MIKLEPVKKLCNSGQKLDFAYANEVAGWWLKCWIILLKTTLHFFSKLLYFQKDF